MPTFHTDELDLQYLKVGSSAPDFVLKTDRNEDWKLSDHRGSVAVLLFYPQNETLVCTKQLCSVRDNWAAYLDTRAEIVGISPATPNEHRAFSKKRHLPIPLLADPSRQITSIFSWHWLYPVRLVRAVVVIDAEGIIRNREVMSRAFRPSDTKLITNIYAARGDTLNAKYQELKQQVRQIQL